MKCSLYCSIICYCEIIINHEALIFVDFMKIKTPQNTIFPLIVASNIWNYKFKNPRINAFCRNHENRCQRIKVPSQYMLKLWSLKDLFSVLFFLLNTIIIFQSGNIYLNKDIVELFNIYNNVFNLFRALFSASRSKFLRKTFLTLADSLFCTISYSGDHLWFLIDQKKIKNYIGLLNEHKSQVSFQWFSGFKEGKLKAFSHKVLC